MKKKMERVKPFAFGKDGAKKARKKVIRQEEDGARLIGGRRHVGSGAITDLKSDASSDEWQQESKQTAKKSMSLKLEWLYKICVEAKTQDKRPMVHIRFTEIPEYMVMPDDWVLIPAKEFKRLREQ